MEVIAATKGGGFLIQATAEEIKEIVNAVTGARPDNVQIGQKIPAIDYASTITKVKSLKTSYIYKGVIEKIGQLKIVAEELQVTVENASNIEI